MAYVISADALIDWDTLVTHMGDASDFDSSDEQFGIFLINAVSARANKMTKRNLKSRVYTDQILDGSGTDILILPQYPVTAIAELSIDTLRDFGADTVVDSDDYESYGDGRVYVPSGVSSARRCVKVTYTAGLVTVDYDLQEAAVEAIVYNWKRIKSKSLGTRSISADGVTTQYEIDIPIPAKRVFESYRKVR